MTDESNDSIFELTGLVTWLKGWIYDKTEILAFLNLKANVSDLQTTNSNVSNLSSALNNKVDKITGKGLSTEDYTTAEKNKLSGIEAQANKTVVDSALDGSSTNPVQNQAVNTALGNKVDKVSGKQLSTNDYTTAEKNKLSGIAANANNYSHPSTHASSMIVEASALGNIGTSANATQHDINVAINNILTTLIEGDIIQVVTTRPAASASTMNKIYFVPNEEQESENMFDVFISYRDGNTYGWERVDPVSLDLSDYLTTDDYDDITNMIEGLTYSDIGGDYSNLESGIQGQGLAGIIQSIAYQLSIRSYDSHGHGDISSDGKVGTTANKPLITGDYGAVQAGEFGTAANTFCQGNDPRLSDARTPTSHTHGQVTNDGKITSSPVAVASGDNIVITDASDSSKLKRVANLLASHLKDSRAHSNIGSSANATQATINNNIDTALGNKANSTHPHAISDVTNLQSSLNAKGAVTDDIDWSYNSNGFTNGIRLVPKADDETGTIQFKLKT